MRGVRGVLEGAQAEMHGRRWGGFGGPQEVDAAVRRDGVVSNREGRGKGDGCC